MTRVRATTTCTDRLARSMRPREAPAAICRKVIEAKQSGRREIESGGLQPDTELTYISDCLDGTYRLRRARSANR